ncbi:hypothetical protein DLH80_06775 [Vibrio parahaemolyticus]|nr:hypothetical protein [Vibrio parahaemolyticus]EGR3146831.1 hypothetical protein [Vibrio parahaemolyticus]EGR3161170.1 hypothetical protein [Vibrio parahaemolyticus]
MAHSPHTKIIYKSEDTQLLQHQIDKIIAIDLVASTAKPLTQPPLKFIAKTNERFRCIVMSGRGRVGKTVIKYNASI